MALTVQEALFHASHTLGNAGEQSPVGGIAILNYAGHWLGNSHSWSWTIRPEVKLDFNKDVEHIWLPDDFHEIVGYDVTSGLSSSLSMTSHQHLIDLRTSAISTSTWRYWVAVTTSDKGAAAAGTLTVDAVPANANTMTLSDGYNPAVQFDYRTAAGGASETGTVREQPRSDTMTTATVASNLAAAINDAPLLYFNAEVDATTPAQLNITHAIPGTRGNLGAESNWVTADTGGKFTGSAMEDGVDPGTPRPRLDIWPAPNANTADAITLYYRGRWKEIDEDTAIVPIPEWMTPLYITAIRSCARGFEMEDDMGMDARLNIVRGSATFMDAVRTDDNTQHVYGALSGGAVMGVSRQRNPTHLHNFGTVPDQS